MELSRLALLEVILNLKTKVAAKTKELGRQQSEQVTQDMEKQLQPRNELGF